MPRRLRNRSDGAEGADGAVTSTPLVTSMSETKQPVQVQPPPVISRVVVFFYVMTWVNLLYATYSAFQNARGDYGFVPPVALYMLLFPVYAAINYLRYRRQGGSLVDILWGYDEPVWGIYAFILVSLGLVFWASAETLNFLSLYSALAGITLGMLPWRRSLPLVGLMIVVVVVQIWSRGWFSGPALPLSTVIGLSVSLFSFLSVFVLLIVLLRSRLESELLVKELQQTKARLEEALSKEQEVAVLKERNRMAREMHDVLGHSLSLIAVKIEAAQRLQAVDRQRADAELDATKELVRQSMVELRASLADLRSPTLEVSGRSLSQALESWAGRTAIEASINFETNFEPGIDALLAPVQDALWRVGREAILNAVKHARAAKVELNIFFKDGQVYLSVVDDGVGIPHLSEGTARLEVEGHYGIRGMRERLEALGGQITIKPGHYNKGTMVLASIPLPKVEPSPAARMRERLSAPGDLAAERNI